MSAFRVDINPLSDKYMIFFGDEVYAYFQDGIYCGYYPARVLGISFPEYLRYCRDECGGTIYGKTGYPYVQYDKKEDAQKICKLLNTYWTKGKKLL